MKKKQNIFDHSLINFNRISYVRNNAKWNSVPLGNVSAKTSGYNKMFVGKEVIKDNLHNIVNKFNERKISNGKFYLKSLKEIHPFCEKMERLKK